MEESTSVKFEPTPITFNQLVINIENYTKNYPDTQPFLDSINAKQFSKALRQACNVANIDLIQMLLSYLETQADTILVKTYIEEQSSNGKTTLHWAATLEGLKEEIALRKQTLILPILRLLLKYNPDTSIQDKNKRTFLDYLSKENKEKVLQITLRGFNLIAEDKTTSHIMANTHLNTTNTSNCLMNAAILVNSTKKSIVVTLGAATCIYPLHLKMRILENVGFENYQ